MTLYKDSVSDAGNGFAAMSMSKAKKEILNMSNEEIRLDLEQQRLEKAAAAEIANTANVIKKTGIFDKVDRIYGELTASDVSGASSAEASPEMGGPEPSEPIGGGMESATPPAEPESGGAEPTEPAPTGESVYDKNLDKLLVERKELLKREYEQKKNKHSNTYMNKLIESLDRDEKIKVIVKEKEEVSKLNNRYNEDINNMMNNINELLNK
jgi:hypothetical protein